MIVYDRTSGRRFPFRRTLVALAAFAGGFISGGGAAEKAKALTPDQALAAFQLEAGLRIELVAAEPMVVSPVAFAFDGPRRLYVVENRGYPDPIKEGEVAPKIGRVALLEDTDGDGKFDRRNEFAADLSYPNGIMLWRGGVFVTCAPDIFYFKDTNGDGVADEKKVVLTGFSSSRTAQIRVSHPTLGLDGLVYVTSGLNGGDVSSPLHPERAPVNFSPADGRFDPTTLVFETTGGRGQFGLTFDEFGRRFNVSNRHPLVQVVMEPWQLRRNPHLAFSETSQDVAAAEADAKVSPISRASVSADYIPKLMSKPHTGTFTSAAGSIIFSGTALTPDHIGNVFVCEPAQNLVQRQIMRPNGASFQSAPPAAGREFLATTDLYFRPVFAGQGPDGALYIADMHRREIDHPAYVPEESRGKLDFESGKNAGRIYRIVRAKGSFPAVAATSDNDSIATLVRQLESPDGWWRARAQRLLMERGDVAAAPLLETVAVNAKLPAARVRALWTLHHLRRLTPKVVARALTDADPGVREQGVILVGTSQAYAPELIEPLLNMAKDADARMRFSVALSLGSLEDPRAVPALASIALRDGEDRWTRMAVLSGIGSRMPEFLAAFTQSRDAHSPAFAAVMEDLGRVFGAGAPLEACRRFLSEMLQGDGDLGWRMASVLGLAEGLRGRSELKAKASVNPFSALQGTDAAAKTTLDKFLARAGKVAADNSAPTAHRVSAISLLGYSSFAQVGSVLSGMFDAKQAPELQLAAVRVIERLGDPKGGELLTSPENWARYTPQIREAVVASLTSKPKMIEVLFAAIDKGTVKAVEISSARRTQLLKNTDEKLQAAAKIIFQELEGGDRMKIYQERRETLNAASDVKNGSAVFVRACSACHTYSGVGGKVGPDLTGVRNQPADALLLHIIVPNYEVMPSYQALTVTTNDGRSLYGYMVAENEGSLTIRTAFGTEETVLRKSIASLVASGMSLMPDGLEQTMTKDELVNLIAYLKADESAPR